MPAGEESRDRRRCGEGARGVSRLPARSGHRWQQMERPHPMPVGDRWRLLGDFGQGRPASKQRKTGHRVQTPMARLERWVAKRMPHAACRDNRPGEAHLFKRTSVYAKGPIELLTVGKPHDSIALKADGGLKRCIHRVSSINRGPRSRFPTRLATLHLSE